MQTEESRIPVHVSIIMDGNGRWARERGKERSFGHKAGAASVRACVEEARRTGVKYLSLFAFSEENWGRPQDEVGAIMNLLLNTIEEETSSLMKNNVKVLMLGNRDRLSSILNAAISGLEELTAGNNGLTLIIFLSYSGKWDIEQAAKKMAAEGGDSLEKYLVTSGIPDPDLIIRTSGEQRLSNYLLWQAAYSEFLFVDTLWPDFGAEQFSSALKAYSKRDRRYGKVK